MDEIINNFDNKCAINEKSDIVIKNNKENEKSDIVIKNNRGNGAGGSNTNRNGLKWEDITTIDLKKISRISIIKKFHFINKKPSPDNICYKFKIDNKCTLYKFNKINLIYFMEQKNFYHKQIIKLLPDESYVDKDNKVLFIIEKKYQYNSGSVDEKIQTGPFKINKYSLRFPDFKIKFCYCLNNWYRKKKYIEDLDILQNIYKIKILWGEDQNYTQNLINWLISHTNN
jgi:hypothetical protein